MATPAKKPFLLRLDPSLYEALQQWSDDELRSMNGHLEYLLREALKKAGRKPNPADVRREQANDADKKPG